MVNPIIEWSTPEVWQYLSDRNISHCKLYDEGQTRIGCILCPMASPRQKRAEVKRYPHVAKKWLEVCEYYFGKYSSKLESPEDMFNWWISGKSINGYLGEKAQLSLEFKDENNGSNNQ